jgi:hypothetical protein
VLHKIDKEVGTGDDKRFQSYKQVLPRTFSLLLFITWNQVEADFSLESHDIEGFHILLRRFISVNGTDDDRHDLIELIRLAHKPRSMATQSFFYHLRELNEQVTWLPGTKEKLTDKQLDQAFFDGMPSTWKECYISAGHSVCHDNCATLLRYFRAQQAAAYHSQGKNKAVLRTFSKKAKASKKKSASAIKRFSQENKQTKSSSKKKGKGNHISNDTKCPIHPHSNHTWGECFSNASNAKKAGSSNPKSKDKGKPKGNKKDKAEANAVSIDVTQDNDNISVSAHTTKTSLSLSTIKRPLNDIVSKEMDELCMALNRKIGHPDILVNEFKKKWDSEEGTFIHAFVSIEESLTHHLNDLSLLAMQEVTTKPWCDEFVDVFQKYSDEAYSLGISEVDNSNIVNPIDITLQLRATSYTLVSSMQNARVHSLLCVLFDSGSDKTLIHESALPPGIVPSKGKKRKLIGVTSSVHVDQEITLDNITLPEFSATQRDTSPIRAVVMYNDDSSYDLIIGMDVMQVLGIDIHNTSKTIVWGDERVPFKPRDYFTNGLFQTFMLDAMDGSLQDYDDNLLHSGYKSKIIKGSHYERFSPASSVAAQKTHLTSSQRQDLEHILSKHPKLFSGQLQCYQYSGNNS